MKNINQNIPIEYDPEIISKIKEIIEEGFDKLKTIVKVKESKFEKYYELEDKFNAIALKLEKCEFFNEELDYFLMIAEKILYIIRKNCEDASFGHCDFALELSDFFMEIWNVKLRLINDSSYFPVTEYENYQNAFKRKYYEYNKKFHMEIYRPNDDFSEEKFYRIMESMRSDLINA